MIVWWNVLDWIDGSTVRLVGTSGFEPLLSLGPAQMADTNQNVPVPEAALLTQVVGGVTTVLVNPVKLQSLFPGLLGGLKLF